MATDRIIRPALANDAPAIHRLNRDEFGYDYDPDNTLRRLEAILKSPVYHVLVAQLDGAVVGYIHAQDYDCTYADPMKNILAIAVAGEHRGRGIGRALLMAMEKWARETGAAGIRLSSGYNREGAHQFYERCGYRNRKNQKNFIKHL